MNVGSTELEDLATELIMQLTDLPAGIREGIVMSVGPLPYRRLDCDGRALAYVRTRPKKRMVRVDVSGLWLANKPSRLRMRNANGAATLIVKSRKDVLEAAEYLRDIVERTRASENRALLDRGPATLRSRVQQASDVPLISRSELSEEFLRREQAEEAAEMRAALAVVSPRSEAPRLRVAPPADSIALGDPPSSSDFEGTAIEPQAEFDT
jgi:hypothetical protein